MAALAPAITPDARRSALSAGPSTGKRSVSFGFGSLKPPSAPANPTASDSSTGIANGSDSSSIMSKEEALRLYSAYRSAPHQFPSYDRLRFVRLPQDWLPEGLRDGTDEMDNGATHGEEKLRHWPAFVYNSLAELVRDLGKDEDRMLKAKLILEHRKNPTKVVARLLGWRRGPGVEEAGDVSSNPFEEPRLELIHLSGTSLEDNEAKYGECLSFVDSQLELEDACDELLAKHTSCDPEEADGEVLEYALRFRRAVDMALNCLALDVGAEVLPARRDEEPVTTPTHGVAANSGTALGGNSAAAGTKAVFDVESAKAQPKVEASAPPRGRTPSKKRQSAMRPTDKENRANLESKGSRKESKATGAKASGLTSRAETAPKEASPKKPRAKKEKAASAAQPATEPSRQSSRAPKPSSKSASRASNLDDGPAVASSTSTNHLVDDDVSWKELWSLMKKHGWNWKGGSGLMVDYYYILPGRSVKNGTKDVDFFESAAGAQGYARSVYGWGKVSRKALAESVEEHGKYADEVVPPLEGDPIQPHEPWRQAWDRLLKSGWTWRAGNGLMMDYYYIKPGCGTKNGAEGSDYFVKLEDVQKFCRRNYGWRGEKEEEEAAEEKPKAEVVAKRPLTLGGRGGRAAREKRQRVETFAKRVAENTAAMKADAAKKKAAEEERAEETADDDQSTFTQSGSRPKALFATECADQDVPPLQHALEPHEPWRDAWEKMRKSGWDWKMGSGLMTDYYYIKPGRTVKNGVKGQDYFVSEDEVRQFAMRNYGWKGDGRRSSEDSLGERGRRKRRSSSSGNMESEEEQGKRPRAENAKKARSSKVKVAAPPPPQPTWRELQADGWKAVSAGKYNILHDWYYVRPGADPGDKSCKLGVDYFLSEEDAVKSLTTSGSAAAATTSEDAQLDRKKRAYKDSKTSAKATVVANPVLATPADCRTQPQDPAKPLLTSPESDSPPSPSDDPYEWTNLWPTLQRAGWEAMKAGKYNKLHDWYWVRPNRDPGDPATVLGRHYFASQEEVIEYVRQADSEGKRKKERKSVGVMLGAFEKEASEQNEG